MKIILIAHIENFEENREKLGWFIQELKELERKLRKKIKINWMLEEDETEPFKFEIRGKNRGDVISNGGDFFKELLKKRKQDELGIHIHFIKNNKFDISYKSQKELISNAKKKFEDKFGYSPKSFVGGWWHSDKNTLKILKEGGFKVDASPMPLYKEKRKSWINLFGYLVLNPFKEVLVCDWSNFKRRVPFIKQGILIVPNSVNPNIDTIDQKFLNFPETNALYLDDIDKTLEKQVEIIKNFHKRKINIITIPFHLHSMNKEKFKSSYILLKECDKINKIKFITLQELYNDKKKILRNLEEH